LVSRFECTVSNLRACGPLVYIDNEHAKQLLYALNDHVWGMKIITLEESADFTTLDTEKLFSKFKSHELSHNGCPNLDASFTSKASITSVYVGGHDANPTNTISHSLEFALSSLAATSDEQYESISDDKIVLLARKFQVMHKFQKERRRSSRNSRGCFDCGDTTHFVTNYPKRKKYDYSNKNVYNNKKLGFLLVPLKSRFLSSSEMRREIFKFRKNLFWKLVPCVEVTIVPKFHPV
jgi:hypothetical protein